MCGSQVLVIVQKRTLKGPSNSKLTRHFLCYISNIYGRRFYATYWPSIFSKLKWKWWSNSITVTCKLYQYQLMIVGTHSQPKMVWSPLTATGQVYRLLQAVTSWFVTLRQKYNCLLLGAPTLKCCSQKDFKGTHNNRKDLLTNRKDPWAESKNQFSRT